MERIFVKTKIELDNLIKETPDDKEKIDILKEKLNDRQKRVVGHRWMKKKMDTYTSILSVTHPDELISEFKQREAKNAYKLYEEDTRRFVGDR